MATLKYTSGGVSIAIDSPTTVEVTPVERIRLNGMLFETAKTFLLPSALHGLRQLVHFYQEQPHVLVSGHADTVGNPEYNRKLSGERAESVAAYLADDVQRWMKWYAPGATSNVWGVREDQYMLSAVGFPCATTGTPDAATRTAYQDFQAANGLAQSGQGDSATREKLIEKYMAQDGTTLPASCSLTTHGCGEAHPLIDSGDEKEEEQNRRVEIFLFDGDVDPPPVEPCKSGGCDEYPIWCKQTQKSVDVSDEPGQLTITVADRRGKPIADATVELRGVIDADGITGEDGTVELSDLPPGSYTARATQGIFRSEPKDIQVPSGPAQEMLELPDIAFVVYPDGAQAESATQQLTAPRRARLEMHWLIRGACPARIDLKCLANNETRSIVGRTHDFDGIQIGYAPLFLDDGQAANGVARYELSADGHPTQTIEVTLVGTAPATGTFLAFPCDEIEDCFPMGLFLGAYRQEPL